MAAENVTKTGPITVLIADRQKRRQATCLQLLKGQRGIHVVAAVDGIPDAIAAVGAGLDIVLLDLALARDKDSPVVPLLRAKSRRTHIILLSGAASEGEIVHVIAQGARGYLGTRLLRRFLAKAVRAVAAGESWVSRAMVSKLIDKLARIDLA